MGPHLPIANVSAPSITARAAIAPIEAHTFPTGNKHNNAIDPTKIAIEIATVFNA